MLNNLSVEDQEKASEALWMSAFNMTLKTCKGKGLSSEATFVGMIHSMTTVIRMLFTDMKEN